MHATRFGKTLLLLWSAAGLTQTPGVPTITLTEAMRSVEAQVQTESASTVELDSRETAGAFVSTVSDAGQGTQGSAGTAFAEQETQISSFSMNGSGSASVSAVLGGGEKAEVDSFAEAIVSAEFTIPVNAPWSLTGSFDAGRSGNDPNVFSTVSFAGLTPSGVFFESAGYRPGDPDDNKSFIFSGTAAADSALNFGIAATAGAFGNEQFGDAFLGEGFASFNFRLDFGDRDGDGLLDDWEENGIDFDGVAPPDIDLPAMGADPDVKDIFVEIDVMNGVPFSQVAFDEVIAAFARAPVAGSGAENGQAGIQLHLLVGADRPTREPIVGSPSNQMSQTFYDIKQAYFGTEEERNHPHWKAIRAAKLMVFRYCLWADTIAVDFDQPVGRIEALGLAEGIPSNDFMIAGGDIDASYSDYVPQKWAGTFMHELGHTLGLSHGGQDNLNFKPNYLSIMNYAYTVPYAQEGPETIDTEPYWVLDYSRTALPELNETSLDENQGPGAPPGRVVIFNSAAASDPQPVQRAVAWGHLPYANWNANDSQTEGPYTQDITRSSLNEDVDYQASLKSHADWNQLYYHLTGSDKFDDRAPFPFAKHSPALEKDLLDGFHNVPWVDLVQQDDLVFEDAFEPATR